MRSSAYWEKRFLDLEAASNAYGVEAFKQIEPAFDSAQREIEREIERWYGRFAKNNQITMQEARKLLTSKELKELKWDVEEYIKYGRENAINQKWMKELENASARFHINRLEALKIRTQQAAEKAFGNELDVIDAMARKVFTEDYYHSIFEMQKGFGIGWNIGQIDERKLDTLISKPWAADGKNFSDRIWGNRVALVNELHQQLARTCILGKPPDDAIKTIAKKMNTSKNNAGKLVMTEQAYFHSVAQREAFKELDVEEFEFVATLDSSTSEVCREMDGKHLPMSEYRPGETAPPLHPWCRSVTVPYFEDNFDGERAARGADGKTYYVPDKMKYNDWKECFVDKTKDPANFLTPVVIEDVIETAALLNRYGKEIIFDEKVSEESKKMIEDLSRQYNTRLEFVKIGSEKAAGHVDMSGATIHLSAKDATTAIHEFAHTLSNADGTKYNLFTDEDSAFWKEIRKIRTKYMKDVGDDVSRWISSYEHSSKKIDEFMAEAFTHAKMKELGLPIPSKYGIDFTYSDEVLKVIDKYFKKSDDDFFAEIIELAEKMKV